MRQRYNWFKVTLQAKGLIIIVIYLLIVSGGKLYHEVSLDFRYSYGGN